MTDEWRIVVGSPKWQMLERTRQEIEDQIQWLNLVYREGDRDEYMACLLEGGEHD